MLKSDPRSLGERPKPIVGGAFLSGSVSSGELVALGIVLAALVGFGVYGAAIGAPSTTGHLISVVAVALVIMHFRRSPIPGPLAIALALDVVAHLAGGLIRVGQGVLYDASIGTFIASAGTHALQFDHFVHAYGCFLGTLLLWTLLVPAELQSSRRSERVLLCVLGGLGLGGLNETIEFLATVAHSGAHVGGYTNTGWDLVFNLVGAGAAGRSLATTRRQLAVAA